MRNGPLVQLQCAGKQLRGFSSGREVGNSGSHDDPSASPASPRQWGFLFTTTREGRQRQRQRQLSPSGAVFVVVALFTVAVSRPVTVTPDHLLCALSFFGLVEQCLPAGARPWNASQCSCFCPQSRSGAHLEPLTCTYTHNKC